jgi:hypothetical protein
VYVRCELVQTVLFNDDDREIPSVVATCGRCDHQEECFGTSERSVRRCLVLLRESCPKGEKNFYTADEQ